MATISAVRDMKPLLYLWSTNDDSFIEEVLRRYPESDYCNCSSLRESTLLCGKDNRNSPKSFLEKTCQNFRCLPPQINSCSHQRRPVEAYSMIEFTHLGR